MGFTIGNLTRLPLGWQGESNARLIDIDMSEWMRDWPNATVDMLVQRPGEEEYSPVEVKLQGGHLLWKPTRADVLIAGMGRAQIILTDANDVELRTRVVETIIGESLKGTEGEAPAHVNGWLHEVLQAAQDAREAVDKMPRIGENGTWLVWDAEANAYVDTGIVADAGTAVKLKNLVDGPASKSVRNVGAMMDGDILWNGDEYKQGIGSSALGTGCAAAGISAMAAGFVSEANGHASFAAGTYCYATGKESVAMGVASEAHGDYSMAQGNAAEANGENSVAMGKQVTAESDYQTVFGRQNIPDKDGKYAFIIGNGDAETVGNDYQSNAFAVDWEGNAYAGNGKKLATEEAVEAMLKGPTILPETYLTNPGGAWLLLNPWEQDIVSGQVYTITYNGTPYDCKAVPVTENGRMFHALGNLALADLPGGNPNTPFCLIAIPNAQVETGGFYGMLLTTETPDSVTLSVVGSRTSEVTPPVQYTITIDQDGVITTDLDSEKLSSMTDAQIQASVTVLEDTGKGYIYTSGVDLVTRMEVADAGIEWVQLRIGKIIDFGSGYVNSAIARYIDFMPDAEPSLSTRWTESMPHMTHWDKGTAYMRYNGRTWEPVGIDQLKADLGLGGGDTTTDVFYTADGQVFTTVDGAVLHVQKGAQ